ncbi:MAG TPA: class I SAM-dependent methyltransferase [Chloroflexota bacterium]|nr:class I SAM-dependent methyltransferase [Chloroflexota bacterium]
MRLLEAAPGARVLDVGCAFGFGTRMLGRKYDCTGIDSSAAFIARAGREVAGARFVRAQAEALPFADQRFDAAVCLEVLEHLADEAPAVREIWRVLKPEGELVLSVPHTGALEGWDSLNVYQRRTGRQLAFPLGEAPGGARWHRHYGIDQIEGLLQGFRIDQVRVTGLGLAELANSGLLALTGKRERVYERLQWLYFAFAVLDDELPAGRLAYNLMIHARKVA